MGWKKMTAGEALETTGHEGEWPRGDERKGRPGKRLKKALAWVMRPTDA